MPPGDQTTLRPATAWPRMRTTPLICPHACKGNVTTFVPRNRTLPTPVSATATTVCAVGQRRRLNSPLASVVVTKSFHAWPPELLFSDLRKDFPTSVTPTSEVHRATATPAAGRPSG